MGEFKKVMTNRAGVSAMELALMVTAIALAIAVGAGVLGTAISAKYDSLLNNVNNAF